MNISRHTALALLIYAASGLAGFAPQGLQGPTPVHVLTAEQREVLGLFSIVYLPDGQGGSTRTLRIQGVNVQIVNGLGATNGSTLAPLTTSPLFTQTNGLGNLIIGYDEIGAFPVDRRGSHNLVVGQQQSYPSYGGFVAGRSNTVSGNYSSVLGGTQNDAGGESTAIVSGFGNATSDRQTVVCGGVHNLATAEFAWVGGGEENEAGGDTAAVVGGFGNLATGTYSAIGGGDDNLASGTWSRVCGGYSNTASHFSSTVGGGSFNQATNSSTVVSGGRGNVADGLYSTVGGGSGRVVTTMNTSGVPQDDWVGGGLWQDL